MTALVGSIGPFDSTTESWEQYAERLGHFFSANGITNADRQRSILLSEVGPSTYALVSSLVSPDKAGVIVNLVSQRILHPGY